MAMISYLLRILHNEQSVLYGETSIIYLQPIYRATLRAIVLGINNAD